MIRLSKIDLPETDEEWTYVALASADDFVGKLARLCSWYFEPQYAFFCDDYYSDKQQIRTWFYAQGVMRNKLTPYIKYEGGNGFIFGDSFHISDWNDEPELLDIFERIMGLKCTK